MLKKFISYYKPYRRMLLLDMIASFFISLIGMVYPIVTRGMLETLIPEKLYREIVIAEESQTIIAEQSPFWSKFSLVAWNT